MDNDLERSVRLLEDALVMPSKGIFRTPNKSQSRKSRNTLDFSVSLSAEEARNILECQPYDNTMALLMDSNKSLMGSMIQTQDPWRNTTNNLYLEFADILQGNSGGNDILEVAADLARCCSDTLSVVQKLKEKVSVSQSDEKWLESERNSWRLLYVLYQDRLQAQNSMQEDFSQYLGTSEKVCVEFLFKRDHLIRESQLIIDWLERNALERDDPILHRSDWTYGWENTLHQLLAPDTIAIGSNLDIVKSIFPDVPQFEGLSLHHLDVANEKQLCKRIFTDIRCGQLEEAQELCYNCGHPWRAAMLEGWKLFHNPNIKDQELVEEEDSDESSKIVAEEFDPKYGDVEGNISRDLWKATAIDYCKKPNLNTYEKAAVASLCGHLETILSVCNSWEDYLWAYMRTMVDIRVESEIRDCIVRNYVALPEEYWEQKLSLGEIFKTLESSKNPDVSAQAKETDHIIQKHIILDDIPNLIKLLEAWSDDITISTHTLRFFAHLILFFDHVGESSNKKGCERIIEAYIGRLSEMNETRLVAFYVGKLGRRKQIIIYAAHLEKITENEERKAALSYAEDYNIDALAVTKTLVETVRSRPSDLETTGNLHPKITEADEVKISALDWLIFYEEQRLEALIQVNALIFKFLTLKKLDAAHLALNKIPGDSIDKIVNEGEVSDDVNQTIKEFLSYKAYLDAHEAFNDWFRQFRNKPIPPPALPESAQFTEKVAHQHRMSQHNAELERWRLTTSHAAKTAKTMLYNVLLFPQGWLAGAEDAEYLRSVCIPEVVLLLYSVLSEQGMHEEAVQLADLLAAEKYGIYKVYSQEKLAEILEKICESSVALLNAKKDPWGNPTSA